MIKVTASAHFPQMKPAKDAYIASSGEGSNFFIACRDALKNLQKDARLKGKRTENIAPMKVTFSAYKPCETEE